MTEWFADTSFWLAFLNEDDDAHRKSVQIGSTYTGHLVTTEWVLVELANAMSQRNVRAQVVGLVEWLENNDRITVVRTEAATFRQGFELYRTRQDKDWSLTDCISFRVMEERGIREALTGDHHFEQAGFVALLK